MFSSSFAIVSLLVASVTVQALPTASSSSSSNTTEFEKRALATVYTQCKNANQVALTFDDGPYYYHRYIADLLSKNGAKGTFFVNGNNYVCIYDQDRVGDLNYAIGKGHEIAAHTWSHPHLNSLSYSQIKTEFTRINTAIQKTTGKSVAFMRPPYGEYNNNVRAVASELGQGVVMWDQDSGDSVGASISAQKKIYSNYKTGGKAIFLNHEVYKSTAYDLLPSAISSLKSKGYKMVSLSECLGQSAYKSSAAPGKRDGSWHC